MAHSRPVRGFTSAACGRAGLAICLLAAMVASSVAFGGCSSTAGFAAVGEGLTDAPPAYQLAVLPRSDPKCTTDGFEVIVEFELRAGDGFPFRHLVQEIRQTTTVTAHDGSVSTEHVSLVEAFRLSNAGKRDGQNRFRLEPLQRDRHYDSGFEDAMPGVLRVDVSREILVYPALVDGADWTAFGFAHLPKNRDGSLVTRIPPNFNRSHQQRFQTKGRVLSDDRNRARVYHIDYRWTRDPNRSAAANLTVSLRPEGPGEATVWRKSSGPEREGAGR